MKQECIPTGFKLVLFDVKSLFTNLPLDQTIQTALKKEYMKKKKEQLIYDVKNERSLAILYKKRSIHV